MPSWNATMSGDSRYFITLTVTQRAHTQANINNNQSIVDWALTATKTAGSGYWTSDQRSPYTMSMDGTQIASGNIAYNFSGSTPKTIPIASGTRTINHNADGTKTLSLVATWRDGNNHLGSATISRSMTLTTIPRTTTPTLNYTSRNFGLVIRISTPRASSSFTHTLQANFVSGGYVNIATGVATYYDWTIPLDYMNRIPNTTSGTVTIKCITYNGSTKIGERNITFTATVPTSIRPSLTGISHSEYVAEVASKVGAYVQRQSRLNLAITGATGAYSSTITNRRITFAGQTLNAGSGVTGVINESGNLVATATITDSRGRTNSTSVQINVLAYNFPRFVTAPTFVRTDSAGNNDPIGTYVKVTLNVAVSSLVVGSQKNSLRYIIQSRQRGTSSWTTKVNNQLTTITYNGSQIVMTYSIDYAYDFNVQVVDIFNTTTSLGVAPTGSVTMQWGDDWIAVGKTREYNANLEVGSKGFRSNGPIIDKEGYEVRAGTIRSVDTRATNQTPQWYFDNYPNQISIEFKQMNTIGLSAFATGTYGSLMTITPWSGTSGGEVKQVVWGNNNEAYFRTSSSASAWRGWTALSLGGTLKSI